MVHDHASRPTGHDAAVTVVGKPEYSHDDERGFALFSPSQKRLLLILLDPAEFDPTLDDWLSRDFALARVFHLEIIQTMLDTIDWSRGASTAAYLVRQDGSWRLDYREIVTTRIRCPLFAPVIEEQDIEITRWSGIDAERREGLINGKDVDVWIPLTQWGYNNLELMMRASRALKGSGCIFDVVCHVVRGSTVVGIATEAAIGRLPMYADRAAIYEALAKIQEAGVIYRNVSDNGILITDQGVRFTELASALVIADPVQRAEEAHLWHWKIAEHFFEVLRARAGYYIPPPRLTPSRAFDLPRLPTLQRPLIVELAYLAFPSEVDASFLDCLTRGFALPTRRRIARQDKAQRGVKRRATSDLLPGRYTGHLEIDEVYRRAASDGLVDDHGRLRRKRIKTEDSDSAVVPKARRCFRLTAVYEPYSNSAVPSPLMKLDSLIKIEDEDAKPKVEFLL